MRRIGYRGTTRARTDRTNGHKQENPQDDELIQDAT